MAVWIAPLVVGTLSAVLASIIAWIDHIVNNYADIKIDLNQGKKVLKVKGGTSLLSTLAAQEIFIPSACGGKGSCGACKVKVLSDVGAHLPTEKPFMSEEELKNNIHLSCQIKLKENIQIQIPEALLNSKHFEGLVESLKDVTHDIKELKIKLLKPSAMSFRAGQYIQLVIPPYGEMKEPTQRAYSVSSKPSDKGTIELLIRLVPNGIATTYVHQYVQQKQKITTIGPFGDFYVRDTDTDMVCVAGGSGMAPIKSILFDLYEKKVNHRTIWYFFGARSKRDLFYSEIFQELEKKWTCFHYVAALSEPLPEDNWTGETGFITQVLDRYFREKMDTKTQKEGYLCGSPGMINACKKVMTQNGIREDKIYYDKFA